MLQEDPAVTDNFQRKPLDKQIVVVCGAATSLGRATSRRLAAAGAIMVLVGRGLHGLARELQALTAADPEEAVRVAFRHYARVDTWVDLAGACPPPNAAVLGSNSAYITIQTGLLADWAGENLTRLSLLPHTPCPQAIAEAVSYAASQAVEEIVVEGSVWSSVKSQRASQALADRLLPPKEPSPAGLGKVLRKLSGLLPPVQRMLGPAT